jgi:hypothetical protein
MGFEKREREIMRTMRRLWLILLLATIGCTQTPYDLSQGPAPLREPPPETEVCGGKGSYEDSLTGGQIFNMYCSYCHNAPSLAERPFSNYQNVAAHMRVRANLTGKEYAKLMAWLRRWHDVPPPNAPPPPSPKRVIFSQPTPELQNQPVAPEIAPQPRPLPPPAPANPAAEAPAKE